MLDLKEKIREIFPVRNWFLLEYKMFQETDTDYDEHWFLLQRDQETTEITLITPRPVHGVYEVDGTYKVMIKAGVPGANFCRRPGHFDGIRVYPQEEVLRQAMRDALASGLLEDPDNQRCQSALDKWFGTSPLMRQVDPFNMLQVKMTQDVVHLELGIRSMDPRDRLPTNWPGRVDVLTTPQGNRILQTYQTARDSGVDENGRMIKGKSMFSAGMESCLLFPENSKPHRLMVTRAALQNREVLVDPDQPFVAHHKYEDWMLFGKHLVTAVLDHPMNYEDCIVVSHTAARKMACYKFKAYTLADVVEVVPQVQTGDGVGKGTVLAQAVMDDKVVQELVLDDNMMTEVFSAETCRSRVAGGGGFKAKIKVFGIYPLEDGDKLITRHGNKGVVRVIPDEKMPITKDGRRVEVLLHPKSVYSRRCFGPLREMGINRVCQNEGKEIRVKHMDTDYGMNNDWPFQDTEMKTGSDHPVYVGPLYWIRVDKHARDVLSAMGERKPTDFRGLTPDAGKSGGQRFGQDAKMVMIAKGMEEAAGKLVFDNLEPAAISMATRLTTALLHKDGR